MSKEKIIQEYWKTVRSNIAKAEKPHVLIKGIGMFHVSEYSIKYYLRDKLIPKLKNEYSDELFAEFKKYNLIRRKRRIYKRSKTRI